MSIDIRRYKTEDYDQVWALHKKTVLENDGFVKNTAFHTDMQDIENFYAVFFVIVLEEKIIGIVGLKKLDPQRGEMKRLQVDSDYQRRGYAKLLIDKVIEYCREEGLNQIVLDVSEPQKKAHELYKSYGFLVTHKKVRTLGPDNEAFLSTYMKKVL